MRIKVIDKDPWSLTNVSDHLSTHVMCKIAVKEDPYTLKVVPDQYKNLEICERAVIEDLYALEFVFMDLIIQ